jgi:type VI protein secretion system component Hcp
MYGPITVLRRNQMSDEPKKDEQAPEVKTELSSEPLAEKELDKVAGGESLSLNYGTIKWTYTQQKRAD